MAGTPRTLAGAIAGHATEPLAEMLREEHLNVLTDLEAIRGVTAAGGAVAVTELQTLSGVARTWMTEVDADDDNLSNQVDYLLTPDGVVGGSFAFSAGAAVTLAATGWVKYRIAGIEYTAEMPATVTLEDLGDITQSLFGSWRVEISRSGAVTAKASPTVGGYTTEQIALLALGGLAPTASCATLGYLTVVKTGSAFNIGTDNLTVATATATVYYERGPRKRISGLNAAHGAASTLTAASTTFGHGTYDPNVNGLKVTQIAAQAAQALTDADTIATLQFGNVLILSNLAKTGFVTLNGKGTPGVTAIGETTAALALTASDLVCDRLPSLFVPLSLIKVSNQAAGTFTFKTTNWDAASVTSTITDAALAGWDRTVAAGFNSHQVGRVAIPANVTAPVISAVVAPAPSATAVDTAGDLIAAQITIAP